MTKIRMFCDMPIEERAAAIRTMMVGVLIADYGARLLKDNSAQDLRQLVNAVMQSVKRVEQHFLFHPNTDTKFRETFRREFLSNNIVLLVDLLQTIWGLSENSLEEIVTAIKGNIDQNKNLPT